MDDGRATSTRPFVPGLQAATPRDFDRPHVVLLVNNPFVADSRGWKVATSLGAAGYRVTVVGRAAEGLPALEVHGTHRVVRVGDPGWARHLPGPRLPVGGDDHGSAQDTRRSRLIVAVRAAVHDIGRGVQAARYLAVSRARVGMIAREVPAGDIWQAESIITLSLAVRMRRRSGGAVVYDANDIDSEAGRFASLPSPWRALLRRHERSLARAADAVVTVSGPYARILATILSRRVDVVVLNASVISDLPDPPERRFHARFQLLPDVRVLLYLGLVMRGRGLEQLFDALASVADAILVIVGFGPDLERVRGAAAAHSQSDRIRFMDAVPPGDVLMWNASADIAVMPVQPDTLNHRYNTPTKLYDAMAAGVPVVASDLPGMAPIVTATGCGELCDPRDPRDIARAINIILDSSPQRRAEYGARGRAAARDRYSWEAQARILMDLYASLGFAPPFGVAGDHVQRHGIGHDGSDARAVPA